MAWAQNLLGFCLFACASQTPFSWVWSGGLQASKSYVAQRFALLEATFFLFLVVPNATCRHFSLVGIFRRFQKQRFGSFLAAVSHGLGIYFLLSNGFQQRRFGIFPAAVSQWLGHKTCCASQTPFSWVWPGGLQVFSLFLVGSKSNVSAVFWLRFRMVWALVSHGLGPISFSF